MCFPTFSKSVNKPTPLYNEDGTLNDQQESEIYVNEAIPEHIDNIYINFDFEDGILAYVYKNANGVFIVWTSQEAEEFGQICELVRFEIL